MNKTTTAETQPTKEATMTIKVRVGYETFCGYYVEWYRPDGSYVRQAGSERWCKERETGPVPQFSKWHNAVT